MKNILLYFSLVALIAACQKTDKLTPTEKKVIGSWYYEAVDFRPVWGVKENLISDFNGYQFTFNSDFSVNLLNQLTNESYSGVWEINQVQSYNSTGEQGFNEQLLAALSHSLTGEPLLLVWDNLGVMSKRIRSSHTTNEGTYFYYLRKN